MNATSSTTRMTREQRYFIALAIICTMAAAFIQLAFNLLEPTIASEPYGADTFATISDHLAQHIGTLLSISVLTALVEEIIFRGILLRALLKTCSSTAVTLITAGAFALLHAIPFGMPGDPDALLVTTSLLVKFVQALAFGIVMAGLVMRGGNLLIAITSHACFDAVFFAVPVLSTGAFPSTYIANTFIELVPLLLGTLCMVPAAYRSFHTPLRLR